MQLQQIDLMWDSYNADSLKTHVSGTGNHLRASERTSIPQNRGILTSPGDWGWKKEN